MPGCSRVQVRALSKNIEILESVLGSKQVASAKFETIPAQ